jgi:hypothetical protein
MMTPIFVMKSVVDGHFVPFFVKYIKRKSPSRLQRLTGRTFVPLALGRDGGLHNLEWIHPETKKKFGGSNEHNEWVRGSRTGDSRSTICGDFRAGDSEKL